ncbi:MAG: BF3164 family lipoprotein [Bacteroidetes bacterium]|nr:BF3164 family lipoprotein [Bacteroidota bacterium]
MILIISVLLIQCFDGVSSILTDPILVEFSTDTLVTFNLDGELFIDSDSLENPTDISVGSSYVFIGDPYADYAITIFDINTGNFITRSGAKGTAPNEVQFLWSLDFKPGSDSGWVYSYPRVLKFVNGLSVTGNILRLTGGGAPMSPVWVENDQVASTGGYESGRIGIYSLTGEFIETIGPDPPGDVSDPVIVRQHVYEAILKTNSDGNRIVVASQNTDQIEIFNVSGLLHLIRGPGFHEPVFSVSTGSNGDPLMMVEDETVQGYVSVAVTDHLIFALYSGRTRGWIRSQRYYSPPAQKVIVFTCTADPIALFNLEDGAMDLGVSRDGRYLYAIYRRPLPLVLRYEIPSLLKK